MDAREYLEIEAALQLRLMKAWRPVARKLYVEMLALIEQADFDGARNLVADIDMSAIAEDNREFAKHMLWRAALFGAKMLGGKKQFLSVIKADNFLEKVTDTFCKTVAWNCTTQTAKAALQSVANAEREYLGLEVVQKHNPNHGPDGLFSKAKSFSVSLGGRSIPMTVDKRGGYFLVEVDTAAFDTAYSKSSFYVGPKGTGASISDRYQRFGKFAETAKSIQASEVNVSKDGAIHFGNGRHRFAWMRDNGVKKMPVAMTREDLKNAKANGYLGDVKVKKAETKKRFVQEFVSFRKDGDAMLQLVSGLHTNRLATWGFTGEAEILGLTTYQLVAVLDGRTSEFCRAINGKVFQVADARKTILEVLNVENPDDVKAVQPWPKGDKASIAKYGASTPEELTALNLHIPPFHPGCRTILLATGKTAYGVPQLIAQASASHQPVKATAFSELGIPITQRQIDMWNQSVSISPTAALSSMSGWSVEDLIKAKFGSKAIKFGQDGSIRFDVASSNQLGPGTMTKTSQVYDPFTQKLYLTRAEFENIGLKDSMEFVSRIYEGMVLTATEIGAKEVSVAVAGSGVLHTKMGFVPATDLEWRNLADDILEDIGTLNLGSLSEGEVRVLMDVLGSNDAHAIRALVSLDFKVKGREVGRMLLEGRQYDAVLDLGDATSKKMFEGWSK